MPPGHVQGPPPEPETLPPPQLPICGAEGLNLVVPAVLPRPLEPVSPSLENGAQGPLPTDSWEGEGELRTGGLRVAKRTEDKAAGEDQALELSKASSVLGV